MKKIIKVEGGGGSDIVDLISNIPDDAQILLSINWENLAKTSLIDMIKEMLAEDYEIIEQMGIDIHNDIKHVILAITFEEEPEFYGVIAGNFDSKKILNLVEEAGAEIDKTKMGTHTVYAIEDLFLTFTKTGVLFAGSDAGGKGIMEKMLKVGKKNLANDKSMVRLVQDTDTSATGWAAIIIPEQLREEMAGGGGDELPFDIDTLRMANFSLDYGKTITLKGGIHFSKSSESENLINFLKDQISAMMEVEGFPEDLKAMLEKLEISADGKVARSSLSLKEEEFQAILKQIAGEFTGEFEEEWEEEDEWGDDDEDEDDDEDDWDDDDDD